MGWGSGQVHAQALASSSHMMSSRGPGSGPASIPGPGLVFREGTLPSGSPQGPGTLPSPRSGLGNLFNAEASRPFADFALHHLKSQCLVSLTQVS